MNALLDTDILIDHLRGVSEAKDLLMELAATGTPAISVITVAEIEAGTRDPEREQVENLLSSLPGLPIDVAIARKAGHYRTQYAKTHGVLLPDALIAATAAMHGCKLYTLNSKHYPMDDINVVVPYTKV